jgi:hypothetical protein
MLSEATTIDEMARRHDDFQGGRPILLPDGQAWVFCEPEAIVGGPGWRWGAAPDLDVGLSVAFARLLAKIDRAPDDGRRACGALEAAWFLLYRNYNVSREEFEAIMLGGTAWNAGQIDALAAEFASLVGIAAIRLVAVMRPGVA